MQKIMIVSDTHRMCAGLDKALANEGKIDMLIHCGDIEGDEAYIEKAANCPVYMVAGNNDYFSSLNREIELTIADKKVLVTHGHAYYISLGTDVLKTEGKARGYDIVMFGHIHRPVLEIEDDITVLNPGSLTYPRQADKNPTYMMMYVDDNNEITFETKIAQ